MKKFTISTPETYTTKDGEEKTFWHRVGTIRENKNGKLFMKLSIMPERTFIVNEDTWENGENKQEAGGEGANFETF